MIIIGPLIGLCGALGLIGAGLGAALGRLILRRAHDPDRAARAAAWLCAVILVGGGFVLAVAVLRATPSDVFSVDAAALYIWMGAANALGGAIAIRRTVERRAEVY